MSDGGDPKQWRPKEKTPQDLYNAREISWTQMCRMIDEQRFGDSFYCTPLTKKEKK